MKLLVLGIGQSLRGDDAAGLEAVRLWQAQHPGTAAQIKVELYELPGLALLDLLEGMDAAILVDAVQSPASAGTIIRFDPDALAGFIPDTGSAHGWGVAETLQLGRSLYPSLADCRISLIGIEAGPMDMGADLSPQVQAALIGVATMIEKEVQDLL